MTDPMDVAEKLRVNDVDAVALAVILGELLDRPHPGTNDGYWNGS